MSSPAPVRLLEIAIEKLPYPVITVGCVVCLPLLALFIGIGALFPGYSSPIMNNPLGTAGLYFMISILPAYLLMCFTAWIRSSKLVFEAVEAQLPASNQSSIARFKHANYWPLAVAFGIAYSLGFNVSWESVNFDPSHPSFIISICLVFGQLLLWSVVSIVLFFVILDDLVFYRSGKQIAVNLYDLDSLNGFGRAGLNGLLMVVGALALTTLQTIDREFNLIDYIYALYVGVPAAIVMVFLPIRTVRRRIKAEKSRVLEQVDSEIKNSPASLDTQSLTRLNGLITRREQIQGLRNWPMDLSIFSRFVLYVFIPPLAWTGAALMEVFLDSFLGT